MPNTIEFAYLNDGTVTGINRAGVGEESTGTCIPQDLVWGVCPEYYRVVGTTITPLSSGEKEAITAAQEKDAALTSKLVAIQDWLNSAQMEPFSYDGHTYDASSSTISKTQQICVTKAGTDPVPTPAPIAGHWKTAELDGSGQPVLIPLTCAEFLVLAEAYYNRNATLWAAGFSHEMAVRALYADQAKTAQDILDYDFTGG